MPQPPTLSVFSASYQSDLGTEQQAMSCTPTKDDTMTTLNQYADDQYASTPITSTQFDL